MARTIVFALQISAFSFAQLGCDNSSSDGSDTGEEEGKDSESSIPSELAKCAFGKGEHKNYFLDYGYSQDLVDNKIEEAWEQLFHGDPDTQAVYYEAGSNDDGKLAYIMDVANDDVRSEGMSYGMMIAVELDKKEEFDALWNFAKTYMWHGDPSHPFYEYFAWNLTTEGSPLDDGPAPDGEEYFAMSLYFASGRWGNGDGIYDYKKEADRLTSAMKNRETIEGDYVSFGSRTPGSGAAIFNPTHKMVRFSPNVGYFSTTQGDHTDPSYHLPGFYQLWSLWAPEEDRDFWQEAAEASRDFFDAAAHPDTGLTPDYAKFDGTPVAVSWDPNKDAFGPDAFRTAMNWSFDWAWFCLDPREQELSDRLQGFFHDKGTEYEAMYELDGTPIADNYYTQSLVAMNAVTALSATDEDRSGAFVENLWFLTVPSGTYRYYDGMLYMLAMLHVSGNFRIYGPAEK